MRAFSALPTSLLAVVSTALVTSADLVGTLDNGLIVEHLDGPSVCHRPTRSRDKIAVHYKGTLESDGSEFDESYSRGKPFEFKLGMGQVIKGWDQGLMDMCVGESRKLTIPPQLAYGDRGVGSIPPKSTLIFITKLVDIVGIPHEDEVPSATESAGAVSIATAPSTPGDKTVAVNEDEHIHTEPEKQTNEHSHNKPEKQTKCHLLGPFALLVQGALGALALLTLVWKRWREVPKRPWRIFFFDVSKQVFGSMLTHVINLTMSMLGSVDMANAAAHVAATDSGKNGAGKSPNPCSFYLLNLGIDTTIGVPVLWFLLKILYHLFLRTPLANPAESIKSGRYGNPPKWTWYLKQLFIYCIGLIGMKLFVFFLFLALPWLPWVGDWALRWTEGNEALQIAFALFVFPLAMNAIQYWVIDNFIMDKQRDDGSQAYEQVAGEDEDDRGGIVGEDEQVTPQRVKEIDPLPIPSSNGSEGSRRSSPKNLDNVKNR